MFRSMREKEERMKCKKKQLFKYILPSYNVFIYRAYYMAWLFSISYQLSLFSFTLSCSKRLFKGKIKKSETYTVYKNSYATDNIFCIVFVSACYILYHSVWFLFLFFFFFFYSLLIILMNAPSDDSKNTLANEALFSIMFVSVGFSCFIWQSFTTGWMAYKSRKPIVILVFFQAILGVFATFITLLIAFVNLDCTFVSDPITLYMYLSFTAPLFLCYMCQCCWHLFTIHFTLESLFG